MNVTVFSEHGKAHRDDPDVVRQHPAGIHETLKALFSGAGFDTTAVYQDDGDDGSMLSDEILDKTDVLVWWGHCMHDRVSDALVEKIVARVLCGMGCIFLHSAHLSKPLRRLLGTGCTLKWREENERERLWVTAPAHPIAAGLPEHIELESEEMYGEHFDIPTPDELVFIGWFEGGEVFRSGVTYNRGKGKIFYFQPGHESNPSYHNPLVRKILINAANWVAPSFEIGKPAECSCVAPLEKISGKK